MTKSSLDVLWDLLQNNSQVLTELIHFRLIKPLIKAHPNTDPLNIVVPFFFPLCRWNRGFCAAPEVKRGTWAISCLLVFPFSPESKQFQQKMIIILIVKPFTHLVTTHGRMRGRNRQRKVKSLGNMVQKLRKNVLNCTSEYHSYWTFQTFFKCLLVILGNILHYRFKRKVHHSQGPCVCANIW